ncbi:glycoside hydrolase family 125 protein [Paenibacillus solisilvae]|uniref:Glycoside hydrolase family 125 protein n=1 Tax=Paenibacillus solisilvae TaxID=2486751 RepID=A0ABW0VY99_9BACL
MNFAITNFINETADKLSKIRPELVESFKQCFPNTLDTTVEVLEDGTTFIITGDIPAMWLRDSSAQIRPYVKLAAKDAELAAMFKGAINRQAMYLTIDPYANAFNKEANGHGHQTDRTKMGPWIWERKYELDSLCYPVQLCKDYYDATGDTAVFTKTVHEMLHKIVDTMLVEQNHESQSPYSFEREDILLPSDTLPFQGKGTKVNYTGMIWSAFRPSDDACKYGYLIPANMFAAVVLGHIAEFAEKIYNDELLFQKALQLKKDVEFGIETYGIVDHPRHGRIYAYETDGFGNYNLMDDANVPSLLSIPYLGYRPLDDEMYKRTRAFVLSSDNPHYHEGRFARGVGSPHTPLGYVWHIGLIVQGLTSTDAAEKDAIVDMLAQTTAGTGYMHESFDPDQPEIFTRVWFAWANSLFGQFLAEWVEEKV